MTNPAATRLNVQAISELVWTLREPLETDDSNRLGVGVAGQVITYAEMLNLILTRYEPISERFIANTKASLEAAQNGNAPDLMEGRRDYLELRLEVESFYLFAKVLLDNISQMMEFYFGAARAASLDSHDDLTKNFPSYAAQKSLDVPDGFVDAAKRLNALVLRFRDKQVVHAKARPHDGGLPIRGVAFEFSGKTRLSNQSGRGTADDSDHLPDLVEPLDEYLGLAVKLFESNTDKTALRVEDDA